MYFTCMHNHIHTAQSMITLLPQNQSVCRGESISYNCAGIGTNMELVSPPIVNETNPLLLFTSQGVQTCQVMANSAAAIVLVDSSGIPSFRGTFTLYISDQQSEGQLTVICRVTATDGMVTATETTLSVFGNVYMEHHQYTSIPACMHGYT